MSRFQKSARAPLASFPHSTIARIQNEATEPNALSTSSQESKNTCAQSTFQKKRTPHPPVHPVGRSQYPKKAIIRANGSPPSQRSSASHHKPIWRNKTNPTLKSAQEESPETLASKLYAKTAHPNRPLFSLLPPSSLPLTPPLSLALPGVAYPFEPQLPRIRPSSKPTPASSWESRLPS